MRVIVVGAGVVGLSCAVRLAEEGHDVHVLARDLPLETTSAVAAGLWYPYRADPPDRVLRWASETYAWMAGLSQRDPASGVTLRRGVEVMRRVTPDPWWRPAVPDLRRLRPPELPSGHADGWRATLPVADTTRFLPWLAARLTALGATLTRAALPGLPTEAEVVVNASGLASRALAGDVDVIPVRGQVVLLERCGVEEWTLDSSDAARPVYVVPRTADVVVGGTAEDGSWDLVPDPEAAAAILDRACALVPALRDARVLGSRVGLRPARSSVRLETETGSGRPVVHCYGHGGAGVTLAWGCAGEVVEQVARIGG